MRRLLAAALLALALAGCHAPPPADAVRYILGGDSRQDVSHVVPWAFQQAKERGAAAFVFLGDMELRPDLDEHFHGEMADLGSVPFFPVMGNHESVHRAAGESPPAEAKTRVLGAFTARFLSAPGSPVKSAFTDKLVYSVDLPGGVHLIVLDNVAQAGFGADQLAWLRADLEKAHAAGAKHIVVGMHKALIGSHVTTHAMDEDGPGAAAESVAALALFQASRVELILASHYHGLAEYTQGGIRSFITGGLGAPLDLDRGKDAAFHHVLVATVPAEGPIAIEVVRFPGPASYEKEREH